MILVAAALGLAVVLPHAGARGATIEPPAAMAESHRAFLGTYCLECHSAAKPEGGMRLDDMPLAIDTIEAAERWQRVLNQLNSGDMPPDDARQPEAAAKIELLDALSTALATARTRLADGGGALTMRRLNRREYQNTILALVGVEADVRSLPADEVAGGFDTAGASLFMSSEQALLYQQLGREAIDAAPRLARLSMATPSVAVRMPPAGIRGAALRS